MLYLGTIMLTCTTECNARIGNDNSGLFLVVKIIFFCFFLVYCNVFFRERQPAPIFSFYLFNHSSDEVSELIS
jgi:hypothetical protein